MHTFHFLSLHFGLLENNEENDNDERKKNHIHLTTHKWTNEYYEKAQEEEEDKNVRMTLTQVIRTCIDRRLKVYLGF